MAAGDYIKILLRLQELHIKASELFGLNLYLNVPRTYFKYFVQEYLKDKSKGLTVVDFPPVEKIQLMNGKERADLYFKYDQTTQIFRVKTFSEWVVLLMEVEDGCLP